MVHRKEAKPSRTGSSASLPLSSPKNSVNGSVKTPGKASVKTSVKILETIRQDATITLQELAAHLGVTKRSIERNVQKLQADGVLKRIGPDKGGHWETMDANEA